MPTCHGRQLFGYVDKAWSIGRQIAEAAVKSKKPVGNVDEPIYTAFHWLYVRQVVPVESPWGGVLHQTFGSCVQYAKKILDPIGSKVLQTWEVKKI